MPLYSYTCRGCSRTADFTRKMENRDNPAYCTTCLAWSSRRIMTAPGLIGETVVSRQLASSDAPAQQIMHQTVAAPSIESTSRFGDCPYGPDHGAGV